MGYTVIKSFERGMDTRRMIDTTEMGGLIDAKNCHVTRGGELEKRAAFVQVATMPAETVGLYLTPGPVFHTWGTAATAPAGMPAGAVYHSIPSPQGYALEHILSVEEFGTKLFVTARYANSQILHWYDDGLLRVYVPPPDPTAPEPPPSDGGVTGTKPSVLVPVTKGSEVTTLYGIHLWTPAYDQIFSIIATDTVLYGFPVRDPPVNLSGATGQLMAQQVADYINGFASVPECSAAAKDSVLQITIEVPGTQYNGWSVSFMTGGHDAFNNAVAKTFSGGLDRPAGTMMRALWNPDVSLLDDEGPQPLQLGNYALAHNEKMYVSNGSRLNISALHSPTIFDPLYGADQLDLTQWSERTPVILSMADYQGDLALFGMDHILIYHMDVDFDLSFKRQVLHRIGIVGPHARVPYGEGDVLFLARSGVRSLRVRSGVDQAYAADIGTLIDSRVRAKIDASTMDQRLYNFWCEAEPRSGRLWMALYDQIYVLSYFPESHITAWTWYDAAACPVDYLCVSEERIFWRSGNSIICYGGLTGVEYDAAEAVVRVPYVNGGKPATFKNWNGLDVAASGTWQISVSFDPTQATALDLIANITQSTYAAQKIAVNGESPSASLELRSTFIGAATIGNATLHYTGGEES